MSHDFYLDPDGVRNQSRAAISQFTEDNAEFLAAEAVMLDYSSDTNIVSAAYKVTQQLFADHILISQALRTANDASIAEHRLLMKLVGTEVLDGSQLSEDLTAAQQSAVNNETRAANHMTSSQSWFAQLMPPVQLYHLAQAVHHANLAQTDRNLATAIDAKIQRYNHIESSTSHLVTSGGNLRQIAQQGLVAVATPGSVNTSWRSRLITEKGIVRGVIDTRHTEKLALFGVTEEQIQNAKSLGYSLEELVDLFDSFETEADAAFFSHLLGGTVESFNEAFLINPWILSDEMTILMADFTTRLFENDSEQFETFVNTLVGMEGLIHPTMPENSIMLNATIFRDGFLDRLFVGTYTALGCQALLLGIGIGDENDQQRFENQKALSGLWMSLAIITPELWSNWNAINLSIDNLTLNEAGEIEFFLSYTCPVTFEERTNVPVFNALAETGASLDSNRALARFEELRRAQEQFAADLFRNILIGASTLALTMAVPKLGLAIGVGNILSSQGRSGSITGINEYHNITALRNAVRAGDFALMQTIGALHSWNDLVSSMNIENRNLFLSWFGSGVSTTYYLPRISSSDNPITLFEGLYNPSTFQHIFELEDNGLIGVGILGEGFRVDTVFNHHSFPGLPPQTQQDIRDLLTGGFIIIGDSENGFEGERFLSAITHIENMGGVNNIQGAWHNLLTGS